MLDIFTDQRMSFILGILLIRIVSTFYIHVLALLSNEPKVKKLLTVVVRDIFLVL